MHAKPIVARLFSAVHPWMHAARERALTDVVLSAVNGNALSLCALALGTARATALRHRVKCVDRLLGNDHLHQERVSLYGALAQWLTGLPQLLIVVDWSSLSADMKWHWLRASVVVQGRSLTLYEEVHPRRHLANLAVHRRFLDKLEQILPASHEPPIVLTDAGFRNPWFRLVAKRGWRWIGRIRNRDYVQPAQGEEWFPAKHLYRRATAQAQDLGLYHTVRNNGLACRLALVKNPPKARKCRYASGKEARNSQKRKIAACNREPWLLSASPELQALSATALVKLYARRMGIEQQFRDTKNVTLGLGLSRSRSRGRKRLQALLLLSHIAQIVLRLIGEAAKEQQLERQLTCTGRKCRAEISVMTLARRVMAQPHLRRKLRDPWSYLESLRRQVVDVFDCALVT